MFLHFSHVSLLGVPGFWLAVLLWHPGFQALIEERDMDALLYLKDIVVVPDRKKADSVRAAAALQCGFHTSVLCRLLLCLLSCRPHLVCFSLMPCVQEGFTLEFHFNPNPYFDNHVLTKTYVAFEEQNEVVFDHAVAYVLTSVQTFSIFPNSIRVIRFGAFLGFAFLTVLPTQRFYLLEGR